MYISSSRYLQCNTSPISKTMLFGHDTALCRCCRRIHLPGRAELAFVRVGQVPMFQSCLTRRVASTLTYDSRLVSGERCGRLEHGNAASQAHNTGERAVTMEADWDEVCPANALCAQDKLRCIAAPTVANGHVACIRAAASSRTAPPSHARSDLCL